jgi:hypothetical protein
MADASRQLPVLIVGGGIGGLAAVRKGGRCASPANEVSSG